MCNYMVTTVKNVDEAFLELDAQAFNLILIDLYDTEEILRLYDHEKKNN